MSRLDFPWKPNSTIWSFMSLVRCKVLPQPGICTMSMWKTFLNVPICLKITNSKWFTWLMPIFRSCHTARYLWHDLASRGDSYLSYSKTMASKTVSLFTSSQEMRWKYWSKWSILKESAWSKQTPMLFGTNLTRRAQWDPPFVLVVVPQKVLRSRFVAGDHSSCATFCFDIHA